MKAMMRNDENKTSKTKIKATNQRTYSRTFAFTTEYNLLQFNTQIKETKIKHVARIYFVYIFWTRFQSKHLAIALT